MMNPRAMIEALLRRLPGGREIVAERDALRKELDIARARIEGAPGHSGPPSALPAIPPELARAGHPLVAADVPVAIDLEARVRMTASCRDADGLPRVANAGAVVEEPDGTRVQIMHNGVKVVAGGYYGAWMQDLITRCRGVHEPQEEVVFDEVLKHLRADATMIEIGGYWSFYSLWFLSGGADRRSIVVEPEPKYLEVGRANARLNGRSPEFINAFVAREPVESAPFTAEASGAIMLPGVSVPFLVENRSLDRLDLLHCDCQGAETSVLESCRDLFAAGRVDWVIVSTHSHHISGDCLTHQRCLALLAGAGATIVAEHDVQESFSGDGLIVAKFGELPPAFRIPALSHNRYSHSLFRNPLYDLATPRPAVTEGECVAFVKSLDMAGRVRLFEASVAARASEFLYAEYEAARFLVNARDLVISRELFATGEADFAKFRVASDIVNREFGAIDVLVDVGANIGGICIPAILRGVAARAIAVEPYPINCRLLRANIAINGLFESVEVVERAAGERDGESLSMEISIDNYGDHRISSTSEPGLYGEADRARVDVRSIRMDSLLPSVGEAKCLIWMDIQGYEGHALRGAGEWLSRRTPLVAEFWPYGMRRADSYAALIEAISGYRGFYDLEKPDRLRPLSELDALRDELGFDGRFTDILVI